MAVAMMAEGWTRTARHKRTDETMRRSTYWGLALIAGLAATAVPGPVTAQQELGIAAIVNEEIISARDLNDRLSLVLATSNLEDSVEIRRRLAPQVLRALIDERLKLQEARRLEVRVSPDDLQRGLDDLERQLGLRPGELTTYIRRTGIDRGTLLEQLEADIAWARAVNRRARRSIRVGDDEIDEVIARMHANTGQVENRVAEIFLAADDPSKDTEVRRLAERLIDQIASGASFEALARNVSQGPSAAVGGDLGWVRGDELGPELNAAVQSLQPGEVSTPIRVGGGYHILLVIDRRISQPPNAAPATVDLYQVVVPLPAGAGDQAALDVRQQTAAATDGVNGCEAFAELGQRIGSPMSGELGSITVDRLSPDLRGVIDGLPVGTPSEPIVRDDQIVVVMACDRRASEDTGEAREATRRMLLNDRLTIAARRLLRDLRRAAFIDVRL